MANIATFTTELGTKTWKVSSEEVKDFSGFSTSYELDAEDNSAVEGSPLYSERGLKSQTVSFSSNLNAHLGIDVRAEIVGWKEWIGKTGILKIGGTTYGSNWLLKTVKIASTQIDSKGRFISSKLTFTFEENDEEVGSGIIAAAEEANAESAVSITCSTSDKARLKSKNSVLQSLL